MFIKRSRAVLKDKTYESILLVQGERVPVVGKVGRPRKGEKHRSKTKVVHRTVANLSNLPGDLVKLIERYFEAQKKGERLEVGEGHVQGSEVVVGEPYGPIAALRAVAKESGLERVLGRSRRGKLALFLVMARVLHQGSRRSAARWANTQALGEGLGLEEIGEKELYTTLEWLEKKQEEIEKSLWPRVKEGTVFLYDVTSSYLEGEKHELGAYGYNRDGKKNKKQIVVGLLTDAEGEPVSVQVYDGHRADPSTVEDQVCKIVQEMGAHEVVLVGDRGMLKSTAKQLLNKQAIRYVTALTKAEVRTKLSEGTLQLDLFREQVVEAVGADGMRYILYRNPSTQARQRHRRADQLSRVQAKVDKRNAYVSEHPKSSPHVSLKQALRWLEQYKLSSFVQARLESTQVLLEVNPEKKQEQELLDGCYVVVSDVPKEAADAQTLWDRYGQLQQVERDFRTMKTGLLEIRPLFLRKANRTRGHALVTLLALKLSRAFQKKIRPLDLTLKEAFCRLDSIRLVSLADPSLGLWRLPTRFSPLVQPLLSVLPPLPLPLLSRSQAA